MDAPALPQRDADELPPEFATLVLQLLAKDPAQRPTSAQAVAEALGRMERAVATPTVPTTASPTRVRFRPRWLGAFAAAALVLTLPLGYLPIDDGSSHLIAIPGPPAPVEIRDPDRRAAEYILSISGKVHVCTPKGDEECVELPQSPFALRNANLNYNEAVTDAGLARFDGCKNLESLTLRKTRLTDSGLVHLRSCEQLRHIDLAETSVTNVGLSHLKNCKRLASLSLRNTRVTDAALACASDWPELAVLDLQRTQVSDEGLAHLKPCTNLMNLSLGSTRVSDRGLEHLAGMGRLRFLYLDCTSVTTDGVARLRAMLPACKIDASR